MVKVLKIENHSFEKVLQFRGYRNDFSLLLIWILFCGANYPKPPGNIDPKFNNKYVTYIK
jgi:hypothetical protein